MTTQDDKMSPADVEALMQRSKREMLKFYLKERRRRRTFKWTLPILLIGGVGAGVGIGEVLTAGMTRTFALLVVGYICVILSGIGAPLLSQRYGFYVDDNIEFLEKELREKP